jgi:TPR repeat protein
MKAFTSVFVGAVLLVLTVGGAAEEPAKAPTAEELQAKAEKGDVAAQFQLAEHFFARAQPEPALKWLRKSAEGGNADGQSALGFRMLLGNLVDQDVAEGRKWLSKAGEQGHRAALIHLCNSYTEGMDLTKGVKPLAAFPLAAVEGTKEDAAGACAWCEKSASAGSAESQYKLGLLYAKGGPELKPDYEKAYFWLTVRNAPAAKALKDKVGEQLTKEKREEIEKKAREFKKPAAATPPPAAPKP